MAKQKKPAKGKHKSLKKSGASKNFNLGSTDPKKLKARDIIRLDTSHLTNEELVDVIKRGASLASRRITTFNNKGLYSAAYEKFLGEEDPKYWEINKDMKHGTLLHRMAQLQLFLESKTSTASGIVKLNKEEQDRIFAGRKTSAKRMDWTDVDVQRRYWSAYNEFRRSHQEFYSESTRIQQELGKMSFWRKRDFTADDLQKLYDRVTKLSAQEEVESKYRKGNYANIFRGRNRNSSGK